MAQASKVQAEMLLNIFEDEWRNKYGSKYQGNRHSDLWAFYDMIKDLGFDDAKSTVKYYFRLQSSNRHDRMYLKYNYDKIYEQMLSVRSDREERRKIMEQTKRRMEELDG